MPNWCSNQLIIRGEVTELNEFITKVKKQNPENGHYDILGSLLPTPQELVDTVSGFLGRNEDGTPSDAQLELEKKQTENIAKYGYKDWYDWNCAVWGTKWGDSDTDASFTNDKEVTFTFQSAWSPPINGLSRIAKMFPNLRFFLMYEELGMGFFGTTEFMPDGDFLDDCHSSEELDIPDDNEDEDWYDKVNDQINDIQHENFKAWV